MKTKTLNESPFFYPGLETLRGLAACMVILHHAYDLSGVQSKNYGWLFESFGSSGVIIFFVLSAFLLSKTLRSQSKMRMREFYLRRIFRIVPAYYFMLVITYVFFAAPQNIFSRQGLWQSIANLLFLQHLSPNTVSNLNVNGALWTLTIEAILYLTLPFIIICMKRFSLITILSLICIGFFFRYSVSSGTFNNLYFGRENISSNQLLFIQQQFPGWLPIFAGGIGVAFLDFKILWFQNKAFRNIYFIPIFMPLIFCSKRIFLSSDPKNWWFINYHFVIGMTVFFIVFIVSQFGISRSTNSSKVGRFLGERSYGLYLWHFPILLSVFAKGPQEIGNQQFPLVSRLIIAAALIFLFAEISFQFIEKPMILKGRKVVSDFRKSRVG